MGNIQNINELRDNLKKLYFYENLSKGEFFRMHISRSKTYFNLGHTSKDKPYLYHLASCIPPGKLKLRYRWLPLHSSKGGYLYTSFIKAPLKIRSYEDIKYIFKQINRGQKLRVKEDSFGYILGMMVSDTSKPKGYRFSNQCLISLTRRYEYNLKIGNSLCSYFNLFGIKAHRIRDNNKIRPRAPYGEYRWITEKSPFIRFLIQTCLDLKNGELTTYDKLRMEWIFSAPKHFIIAFLQGVYDGDGTAHSFWRVENACDPNQKFFIKILEKLNIKAYWDNDAVCISHLPSIIKVAQLPIFRFAEDRGTKLNRLVEKIENRKYLSELDNNILNKIDKLHKKKLSGGEISDYFFDTFHLGITPDLINRYIRKPK